MPFDKSKYPKNWKQISLQIRNRDGWRCRFCGVRHDAWGWREDDGSFTETPKGPLRDAGFDRPPFLIACLDGRNRKVIRIILTVAHLHDTNPMNCDEDNLAALCQRCHLRLDLTQHKENAARTRAEKAKRAGQMALEVP